jgi:hypothetical protein
MAGDRSSFSVVVWRDGSTETFQGINDAARQLLRAGQYIVGDHAPCVTTRPTSSGLAGVVGLRPVYRITDAADRLTAVVLEYGENAVRRDPRDSMDNAPQNRPAEVK